MKVFKKQQNPKPVLQYTQGSDFPSVVKTPKESDISKGQKEKNAVLIKSLLTHDKYHVFLRSDQGFDQKMSVVQDQNQKLLNKS